MVDSALVMVLIALLPALVQSLLQVWLNQIPGMAPDISYWSYK